MSDLVQVEPEYIYTTIPKEYVCVYHKILLMLAHCGELMLQDCKSLCKDKNTGVIECYTMFNAAVAARKLGQDKLAATLIKYIKAKLEMMATKCIGSENWSPCGEGNEPSFLFPIDETGTLKAVISCGETPRFEIDPNDMNLYQHKFDNGFDEHFRLSGYDEEYSPSPVEDNPLAVNLIPCWEEIEGVNHACADVYITYDNHAVDPQDTILEYYFDDVQVSNFNEVTNISAGDHAFMVVVKYNNRIKIDYKTLYYGN